MVFTVLFHVGWNREETERRALWMMNWVDLGQWELPQPCTCLLLPASPIFKLKNN